MRHLLVVSALLLIILPGVAAAQEHDQELEQALTAPLPEADGNILEAASLLYDATIQSGGQEMGLDVERTIEQASYQGNPVWRIVEAMVLPMNAAVDTFELHAQSLQPVRRSAGGSGTSIVLEYGNDEISGSIQAGGHEEDIRHQLDANVFADGAGLELAISTLPLEIGYAHIVRTFDPQAGEARPMQLTVRSSENITTESGSYETFKVDLTPLDGSGAGAATLHLMQTQPHYLVRGEYELPGAMGGGSLVLELTSQN